MSVHSRTLSKAAVGETVGEIVGETEGETVGETVGKTVGKTVVQCEESASFARRVFGRIARQSIVIN